MTLPVIAVTGLMIGLCMVVAYRLTRDALHPMIVLGPVLVYVYVWHPALLCSSDHGVFSFFTEGQVSFVLFVQLAGNGMFCAGCLYDIRRIGRNRTQVVEMAMDGRQRTSLYACGCLLGLVGVGAFIHSITLGGGFTECFGRPKGSGVVVS